jgi:hypothetical protein
MAHIPYQLIHKERIQYTIRTESCHKVVHGITRYSPDGDCRNANIDQPKGCGGKENALRY